MGWRGPLAAEQPSSSAPVPSANRTLIKAVADSALADVPETYFKKAKAFLGHSLWTALNGRWQRRVRWQSASSPQLGERLAALPSPRSRGRMSIT